MVMACHSVTVGLDIWYFLRICMSPLVSEIGPVFIFLFIYLSDPNYVVLLDI